MYTNSTTFANFFSFAETNNFSLFPVIPNDKLPLAGFDWVGGSSRDVAQWRSWAEAGHNLAVNTGASRIIAVDIDVKELGREKGWAHWCKWCTDHGVDPAKFPVHCHTASGGFHLYLGLPAGIEPGDLSQRQLVRACDGAKKAIVETRCGNGYVVAPGSIVDGKQYILSDMPIPEAPTSLIKALRRMQGAELNDVVSSKAANLDPGQVAALYRWMNDRDAFEDYDAWLQAGMAAHAAYGDTGKSIWALTHNETVTSDVIEVKWRSFSDDVGGVSLDTILKRAHEMGWSGNIQRSAQAMFGNCVAELSNPSVVPSMTQPEPDLLKTSADFVAGFEPPDYLIDGVLQRRYCYSLTAQTGVGKTAVAMRWCGHVAMGRVLGGLEVQQGTVLYFAGENPSDIQARWLGLTQAMGVDPAKVDVHFLAGALDLSQHARRITNEVVRKGVKLALVVVDTAAAYNFGDDENSNTQAGQYARQLRSLTELPGGPAVLILCHPTKRAADDDLIPRGGGAFLAEVDGNIALQKKESLLIATAQGKFRGADFAPLRFQLNTVRDHPKLFDVRNRPIPTVVATPVDQGTAEAVESKVDRDTEALLRAVSDKPACTPTDYARALGWTYGAKNEPNQTRVKRLLEKLRTQKLVTEKLGRWRTTPAGDIELNGIDSRQAHLFRSSNSVGVSQALSDFPDRVAGRHRRGIGQRLCST